MNRQILILAGLLPAAFLFITPADSKDDGVLPSGSGRFTSMTRSNSDSCGRCHGGSGTTPKGTVVTVTPTARGLVPGQTIGITVKADNPAIRNNRGGFAADINVGKFVPGSNSWIRGDGKGIAHDDDKSRTWAFNYKAPTTPGLVEFYTVAMASNDNGKKDSGDQYAFHGADPTDTASTPVRMFVNAAGVKPVGTSCGDGYGNYSVLGSPTTPVVGGAFKLEAHGLPTSSRALLMISAGGNIPPVDLKYMGAGGCVLRTTFLLQVPLMTSGGNESHSEGTVILPTMLPNDPGLRGATVTLQVGALDKKPIRPFPMLVTNAIEVTIK